MSRVLTNWAHPKMPKSVLWQIENAPTIQSLTEVMRLAVKANKASKETKLRWSAACERRLFILNRLKNRDRTPPEDVMPVPIDPLKQSLPPHV